MTMNAYTLTTLRGITIILQLYVVVTWPISSCVANLV